MLAACGGGGGGGGSSPAGQPQGGTNPTPTPTPGPTQEELTNAANTGLKYLLNAESNTLGVTWQDTFSNETSYNVQVQAASGEWQTLESLAATPGVGSSYTWQRIIDQSATYRVVAQRDGYVVPLLADSGEATSVDLTAADAMQLIVSDPAPLTAAIDLSIQNAGSARDVQYLVDLKTLGETSSAPNFSFQWDTTNVTDGAHLVLARLYVGQGLRVELSKAVTLDLPNVAVSLQVSTEGTSKVLGARATSAAGIQSVEFYMNGNLIGSPSAPESGIWRHTVETRGMPQGTVTFRVVATDNDGDQRAVEQQYFIDNHPILTLNSPLEGEIVSGTLVLEGMLEDDAPGVTATITLGDVQVLQTAAGSFSSGYSLAGLADGQYTLRVVAQNGPNNYTDFTRQIVVYSGSPFSYSRVAYYPRSLGGLILLDSDNGRLLYRVEGTDDVLVREANGSTLELTGTGIGSIEGPDFQVGHRWDLGADHVVTTGKLAGSTDPAVFLFNSSGQREVIPYGVSGDYFADRLSAQLHGSWLVWGASKIFLRNLADPGSPVIGPIDGRLFHGQAFINTAGNEQLFFLNSARAMSQYDVADGTVTLLSAVSNLGDPRTDGTRVAWEVVPEYSARYELIAGPVDNATAAITRSTIMSEFELEDGLLAWMEYTGQDGTYSYALKVDDGTETVISTVTGVKLYSSGNGHIVFGEGGKLYTWNRAEGKRMVLPVLPREVKQTGDELFFTFGDFYYSYVLQRTTL